MKPKNNNPHDHSQAQGLRRVSNKIKQYLQSLYRSDKCSHLSHGSYDIMRSMSWAHGENWRRNHPKSLNKKHR